MNNKFIRDYFFISILSFIFVYQLQSQLIYKSTTFFTTRYFTLGSQPNTSSGNFNITLTTPINNITKIAISLAEIHKDVSQRGKFFAKIQPAVTGTISSFNLVMYINDVGNMYLSWLIVAIGNQGGLNWIDLVQIRVLNDANNTLSTTASIPRTQNFMVDFTSNTLFTAGTNGLTTVPFMTCFEVTVSDPVLYRMQFNIASSISNTTHLQFAIKVQAETSLQTFRGFVIIFNQSKIGLDSGVFQNSGFNLISQSFFTFHDVHSTWGPKYQDKCVYGLWQIAFWYGQSIRLYLSYGASGGFQVLNENYPSSLSNIYKFKFLCFSDGTFQCGPAVNFYDVDTNSCFNGVSCPIPTYDPGAPYISRLCAICYQIDCTNCSVADKTSCNICDPAQHSTAVGGDCICDTNYIRPNASAYCQLSCTFLIPGCQALSCTTNYQCTLCLTRYYPSRVNVTHQPCVLCNSTMVGCQFCTDYMFCSGCYPGYFMHIYGANISGVSTLVYVCQPCSVIVNCANCTSNLSCAACVPGFAPSGAICLCNPLFITNCAVCTVAFECTTCTTGYILNPINKTCILCTDLSNCTTCTDYYTCTGCTLHYATLYNATTLATTCQRCSDLMSHCFHCTNSTTCRVCEMAYGFDINTSCVLCDSLLLRCVSCYDYTACLQCQNNTNVLLFNGSCLFCTNQIPFCDTCTWNAATGIATCSHCQIGYYLDAINQICIKCADTIYDCLECSYNTLTLLPECTLCSALFLVDSNFTCELCKIDKYVTRTCTNVSGCSSSQMIGGRAVCLSCDASKYFQYNTRTKSCQCQNGFILDPLIQTCLSKCGDGIQVAAQLCDDGNLISNDGCSSACITETGFNCVTIDGGITTCILVADISIIFDYISKNLQKNQASLYFTVSPASTTLDKVDWSKTVSFNFSMVTKRTFEYSNGVLIIIVEYSGNIQDQMLDLNINFDPSLIMSANQTISLKLSAINGPLSYSESSASFASIKTAGIVLGVLCLALLLLSSYFHKLIGLQTVQFIQLLYFSRILMNKVPFSSFYAFNSLKYSNGYSITQFSSSSSSTKFSTVSAYKSLDPRFLKLQMSLEFLQNCNLMLGLVGLVSLAFIGYSLRKSYLRSKFIETRDRQYKDKFTITMRTVNWLYDNCVFSFTLALLYLCIFSTIITLTSQTQSTQSSLLSTASFSSLLMLSFLIFSIFAFQFLGGIQKFIEIMDPPKNIIRSIQNELNHEANTVDNGCHSLYISLYLINQVVILSIIIVTFSQWENVGQFLTVTQVAYFVLILIWRPYLLKIHNLAIILNHSVICMYFCLLLGVKYSLVDSELFSTLSYLILSLIGFCLMLQFVRIYIHKRFSVTSRQAESLMKTKNEEKAQQEQRNKPKKSYFQSQKLAINKTNYTNLLQQSSNLQPLQKKSIQNQANDLLWRPDQKLKHLYSNEQKLVDLKERMRNQFDFYKE